VNFIVPPGIDKKNFVLQKASYSPLEPLQVYQKWTSKSRKKMPHFPYSQAGFWKFKVVEFYDLEVAYAQVFIINRGKKYLAIVVGGVGMWIGPMKNENIVMVTGVGTEGEEN
jgi:hypothetical protein